MKNLTLIASVATISIASFASTSAFADCASEIASLKQQMATGTSSTAQGDQAGAMGSADGSSMVPAVKDQSAVNTASGTTFTQTESKGTMSAEGNETGALSGVAPTAALGQNTNGAAMASGSTDSSSSSGTASATASENSTGEVSGVEPTGEMAKMAGETSGDTAATGSGAMSPSGGADDALTNAGGLVQSHLAAAQMALKDGNESACMAAIDTAKAAM